MLDEKQEPYRSYLAAQAAGTQPIPFFVGLKIKGGVYDGQELVLAYPDTNEKPPSLPKLGGAGGNEGNAGAANKGDSTSEGQRPSLSQNTDTKKEEQNTTLPSIQTEESMTVPELSEQPDTINQQIPQNGQLPEKLKTPAFMPPPAKVQAAAIKPKEQIFESDSIETEPQTAASIENAAATETLPAPSVQSEKTDRAAKNGRHTLLLLIAAAAAIGLGVSSLRKQPR